VLDSTRARLPVRAALLVGSAARGDADLLSDLDLIAYVDELPDQSLLAEIRKTSAAPTPSPVKEPSTSAARSSISPGSGLSSLF